MEMHPSIKNVIEFAKGHGDTTKTSSSTRPLPSPFFDVTLVCNEGKSFPAHRLFLAAHSDFLRQVLESVDDHPREDNGSFVVILADAGEDEVQRALGFVYEGLELSEKDIFALTTLQLRAKVKTEASSATAINEAESSKAAWFEEMELSVVGSNQEMQEAATGGENAITLDFDVGDGTPETLDKEKDTMKKKVFRRKKGPGTVKQKSTSDQDLECCDKKFDNEVYYATHKVKVHSEMPKEDQFIICCDEKLTGTFKVHLQATHKLDEATEKSECCDSTFEDLDDLTRHCASSHGLRLSTFKTILCCATKLTSLEDYKRHKEEDASHLECNMCTFISKDERHLNFHLYVKHNIGSKPDQKSALTCKYCSKTFKRIHLRQDHEDKHDNKFKYSCMVCGKNFKLVSSLRSHLYRMGKNHNPNTKEYNCDSCEKTFNTVIAKRKHTRVIHEKKETPSCSQCSMVFVDRHSLENHMKVAHIKVKDIQCTFCGKLFATQDRMRVHERFVHVVEEEKVPCDICKKEFTNKERMIDHRRSVHCDRKYQCESCGSTFKNSSTLKSHVVSIHMEHDKKPLRCSTCNKGFLHESRLRAHETIHSDKAPFNCQFCGRPNKCKNNNFKHEKRCKKGKAAQSSNHDETVPSTPVSAIASSLPEDDVPICASYKDNVEAGTTTDQTTHWKLVPMKRIQKGVNIP